MEAVTLGWRSFGVRLAIELSPRLARRIRRWLPPGRAILPPRAPDVTLALVEGAHGATLSRDGEVVAHGLDDDSAVDHFLSSAQLEVASLAPDQLFVHAGVVGWRGGAIVLPGRSFAGKSTLVAELVRAGAVYYSDEYAVLDERGWIRPFPRAISLRQPGKGPRRVAADRLGRVGKRPIEARLIVSCRYRAGEPDQLSPISSGQAVLELFKNTVAARTRPADALERLSKLARSARALYGERGEARAFARRLLDEAT